MTNEHDPAPDRGHTVLVYGPPGTGKTTFAAARVKATAMARGVDKVMVVSFTRTAAQEVKGRDLPIPDHMVGTLHSMAFRALGSPKVAQAHLRDWNEKHPQWVMKPSGGTGPIEESPAEWVGSSEGEKLLGEAEIMRARMVPFELWPKASVRNFYAAWQRWKDDAGVLDFTDMIEQALAEVDKAPGNPEVMFLDEAQDATALEIALFRKWGAHADRVVMLGDDDQCLYRFRGASPDALLDLSIPDEDRIVLGQSYRVPERVLEVANRWVHTLSRRAEKEYLPRDAEGKVTLADVTFEQADDMVRMMADRVADGRSVMAIAACSYQLDALKKELKRQGVPFHNPYRRSRGDWNPMAPSTERTTSSADRLLAYLVMDEDAFGDASRLWTGRDVKNWAKLVKATGVFRRGAKGAIEGLPDRELTYEEVAQLFATEDALEAAVEPSLDWFAEHLTAEGRKALEFPIQVYRQRGAEALLEEPGIILGTIHCSPADEPILTTDGWVPIGDLDPLKHRLASHHRQTNSMTWGGRGRQGFGFEKSERPYDGNLVVMTTSKTSTRVTPNHRVLASFNEDFFDKWIVYLMRRGDHWRIGHCVSGRRPYRSGGLGGRLATEQADAGWILGVYFSKAEALAFESIAQGRFGIPGLTFRASKSRALNDEQLDAIHDATADEVYPRVKVLLDAYGLLEDHPLYTRAAPGSDVIKRNMAGTFLTEAANLVSLSDFVSVPWAPPDFTEGTTGKIAPIMLPAMVTTEHFTGSVFGLDVPPMHYYVSGGAVVHNSVKGGQADSVFVCPDLSYAGAREWDIEGEPRDSIVRQFYVAMTRARDELVLCAPDSKMSVPINEGVRP